LTLQQLKDQEIKMDVRSVDDDEVTGSFRKEMASVFPAGENRARR
jgi:hypothetical protein